MPNSKLPDLDLYSTRALQHCLYLILSLLLVGCSSHERTDISQQNRDTEIPEYIRKLDNLTVNPTDAKPRGNVKFIREMEYTDSLGIGTMGHIAVDEEGRVFISEGGFGSRFGSNSQTIHIYNPDGSYLTTMGRAGEGPGEFRNIIDIQIQSNRLFAYDNSLQRVTVFDLKSLAPLRTIILNRQSWKNIEELESSRPAYFFTRNDSTILAGFRESMSPDNPQDRYRRYYLLDREGNIISGKIFEERDVDFHQGTGVPGPQLADSPTLPFTRSSLMAVSDDGHIYSAWTEDFLIKVYDPSGKYLRAFYYPHEKSPLNRDDILERYRDSSPRSQQGVRNTEFPETWPALHYMLLDDQNRLWVCTITDGEEHYEWWVLESSGKLIAKFTWPGHRLYREREERRIKMIKNEHLYALEIDEETGIERVVRYRIEMR